MIPPYPVPAKATCPAADQARHALWASVQSGQAIRPLSFPTGAKASYWESRYDTRQRATSLDSRSDLRSAGNDKEPLVPRIGLSAHPGKVESGILRLDLIEEGADAIPIVGASIKVGAEGELAVDELMASWK